jgi:hypothetical protein
MAAHAAIRNHQASRGKTGPVHPPSVDIAIPRSSQSRTVQPGARPAKAGSSCALPRPGAHARQGRTLFFLDEHIDELFSPPSWPELEDEP